jgi:hypothetical protein
MTKSNRGFAALLLAFACGAALAATTSADVPGKYDLDRGQGIDLARPGAPHPSTVAAPVALPAIPQNGVDAHSPNSRAYTGPVVGNDGTMRYGLTADPAGSGKQVWLHRVRPGDPLRYGSHRAETDFGSKAPMVLGKDYWIAFGVYIDPKWQPVGRQSLWQIHQESDNCDYANAGGTVGLQMTSSSLQWVGLVDPQACDTQAGTKITNYHAEPITKGKWIKYVMHLRMGVAAEQAPRWEIWRNGEKIVDSKQPIGFVNAKPDFIKSGINKWTPKEYGGNAELLIYTTGTFFGIGADLKARADAALAGF